MIKENTHIVIIAGGKGQRFWPLSRNDNPKQLQPLCSEKSLLEQTIERVSQWIPDENIWIIANLRFKDRIEGMLHGKPDINLLYEPKGRDTAAAIGLASVYIKKRNPDAVLVVLPSDHFIGDNNIFLKTLEHAVEEGEKGHLATLGLKPAFAATQYGYLKRGEKLDDDMYSLLQFCEKPSAITAQRFVETGEYYWNSGMFVWKIPLILELFKEFLPDFYSQLTQFSMSIDTDDEQEAICRLYNGNFKNQSIDFGIMEPAVLKNPNLGIIIHADFPWNDLGNWTALENLEQADFSGNIINGKFTYLNSRNNIIWGSEKKLIAGLGLNNLVIVDTGDALLIADKNELEQMKNLLKHIQDEGLEDYL